MAGQWWFVNSNVARAKTIFRKPAIKKYLLFNTFELLVTESVLKLVCNNSDHFNN